MTVRFKNELVRNITIKLGYANAKVRAPSRSPALVPSLLPLQGTGPSRRAALPDKKSIYLPTRSTNAKTRHVRARGTTARTGQTRRTTRRASGQAADTE